MIKDVCVHVGTLDASNVHPREIFKEAIRHNANALIVVHNHPSGEPRPSPEDIAVTRRLHTVGETVGIRLLDHVVIGAGGSHVSIKDEYGME